MIYLTTTIENIDTIEKYIILLLGVKDYESVQNRAYIQREIYVLSRSFLDLKSKSDYKPYFLGPYSIHVSNAIITLTEMGLVRMKTCRIELTDDGRSVFNALKDTMNEQTIRSIAKAKIHLNDLSTHELSAIIHFSYLAEDGDLNDEDLQKSRKSVAMSLYQKHKVDAQKAADIAGESLEKFLANFKTATYGHAV